MDPDERVMALKKAYADIILNTAKEAAARVMVSERKAQRFEHELKIAKEEGLRMLLRIKQMLDAKVSEAELTALSQKKKIDELEAQLHEAEDIVKDLREELRQVQSELERVKSDKAQCLEKSDIYTHRQLEINRLNTSQLAEFRYPELHSRSILSHTMDHAFNDQSKAPHNFYVASSYRGYMNGGSPDLPSIISRRKEPLFYRNGCTQRIRACEKTRLDQEFSLCKNIDKVKDEVRIEEFEDGKVTCNLQRHETENRKTLSKKGIKENMNPEWPLISKRKRAGSHLRKESLSSRNISGESIGTDQAIPCEIPKYASGDGHPNDNRSETSPRFISRECAWNSESGGKLVKGSTNQSIENGHARLTREMAPQNMEFDKNSDMMNLAKGSPSSMEVEPNESEIDNQLPKQTISDRYFKYTFQRKRKRDSLVNENEFLENNLPEEYVPVENSNIFNENCDLENITSQGNGTPKASTSDTITDPENITLSTVEPEEQKTGLPKSFSAEESHQDSLGLLQIAHQLISMSEKVGSNAE
ncbi:hypothetical protein Leryth_013058 [Lithospermum erythrorhizon]|nr:hypothetical protein Leryth_013058 [Lithospermum erythrorhizon]